MNQFFEAFATVCAHPGGHTISIRQERINRIPDGCQRVFMPEVLKDKRAQNDFRNCAENNCEK